MAIKTGSIVLVNHKKGIFSHLIKFFTKSKYSHSAIVTGKLIEPDSVLSAETIISLYPLSNYENKDYDFDIFEMSYDEELLLKYTREAYEKYAYQNYGYLQLLWFVYRWFMGLFHIDVRKQGNWFPEGIICSELVYNYLKSLAQKKSFLFLLYLEKWNSNAFTPEDLAEVINKEPKIFKLVASYKDGKYIPV